MFSKDDIIRHLETLIEKIKKNEIEENEMRELSLLYIKHLYNEKESDDDIKYFSLGWYIHEFLLK
jgi:cobalamin biosynthesis Co2+ chelatase CbiK